MAVPLRNLVAIKGYRLRYKGQDFTHGCTLRDSRGRCVITLATHLNVNGKANRRGVYIMLQTLAHELAHLRVWEHKPDHWLLELQIAAQFAKLLKEWKLKDINCKPGGLE